MLWPVSLVMQPEQAGNSWVMKMQNIRAEAVVQSAAFAEDITFFTKELGFVMHQIMPADDPSDALLVGLGVRLRLRRAEIGAGSLRILADEPALIAGGKTALSSPGGIAIEIAPLAPPVEIPAPQHAFVVRRLAENAPWVVGRAGMQYRDLIPDRLGGAIIASHIRIPDEGPVPDNVHFHSVGFQLIFCYKGWVDLVYEDQGPPFRLTAGSCVIQPPEIRHRVLYASAGLEVIEIGVPAEHLTTLDHDMPLPTQSYAPDRLWDGQRFVHYQGEQAEWQNAHIPGFIASDTGIADNTGGVAGVQVLRRGSGESSPMRHNADLHFTFVMAGSMRLEAEGQEPAFLSQGDAFALPPGLGVSYKEVSEDIELLEVTLPAAVTSQEGLA